MKFKLLGREIIVGKDLSQFAGLADNYIQFFNQRYGVDYTSRNRLKAYKNAVFDCVSFIGEACGDYAPFIEVRNGDHWERKEHEFMDLVRNPTGQNKEVAESFSGFDLFQGTISFQLLQGDCYWYMANGKMSGRPREIVMLRPDKVGVDVDPKTGKINGYFIRQSFGDPIPLEVNEVLRFPMFNPEDPYKGKSHVQAGNDYIMTDESTAKYTKNFFFNNAGVAGVLNVKGEVTENAFKKFVRGWREKHEGLDNAGRVAILRNSDASFEKIGLGLNELDMSNLRKMSLADVFMLFKVPPELLGKVSEGSGLGRGNVETLEYIFAKWNIDKKFKKWDAILEFALRRYYPELKNFRVRHENIIPDDKEYELKTRTEGVDKWLTRDEIRDRDGLDSKPGADQLFVPMTSIPIDEAALAEPAKAAAASNLKIKLIRRVPAAKEVSKSERFRLSLMRNQTRYERKYKQVVKPIFEKQRKEALVNLEAHASSLTKAAEQKLFDDAEYDSLMVKELTPMLTDLSQTQGGLALVFAGDTENEFHMTAQIQAHLERGTRRMATRFNDETLEALNKTLAAGIEAGEGIDDLKRRVNGVYAETSGYRAERIARTETLKASNSASVWAYRQTGYVTGKQWVVNPDACAECDEFNGKSIGLDDSFLGVGESYTTVNEDGEEVIHTNTYDTIEEPPLHPNCRCTVIPITG